MNSHSCPVLMQSEGIMMSALAQKQLFGSSYDLIMEGWQTKENRDGVVYFVNVQRKITSWIHPYVSKVFEELGEFSNIKYAAYRTALKLRFLQVKFGLYLMSIKSIRQVFPNSSKTDNGSSSEDTMSCMEIFGAVFEIMESSDSFRLYRDKLVQASEIILNLILELFDTSRSGKVAKRSVRIALVVLCSAKLSDKYRFFFDEISDCQGSIRREKFLYLIYDLMQITELLKESTAFGTNISAAVNSCLKRNDIGCGTDDPSGNPANDQSSQDDFYSWLLQEPICIVWLPTLHRVVATEAVRHNVQCCVCSIRPMVGFRYRCMQCFHYDLCQSCFFQGLFSQGHRLKHPMQEYCFPTSRVDNTKALLKIVRNKMSKRHRRTKIKHLPVDDDSITGSVFQWQPRSLIPNPRDSFYSSTDSGLAAGSSDNDAECHGQVPGRSHDQAYDDDNLAMMKRWCKPVEVLGEPCNTSSPCVQETMSKKNMDSQQFKMAQTIEQLQEENRVLRQQLSAARKRELDGKGRSPNASIRQVPIPMAVGHVKNQNGDPLKEITTDAPISPINAMAQSASQTGTSFLTDRDFEVANPNTVLQSDHHREICVNVLEIVGSYTPIQSTFCMENNADGSKRKRGSSASGGSNAESGISEDVGGHESPMGSGEERAEEKWSDHGSVTESDGGFRHQNMGLSPQPPSNPVVNHIPMYTDTETESTTSNDLEYTYSDMSLKSEAASSQTSKSSKTRGVVMFESMEPMRLELEQKGVIKDETDGHKMESVSADGKTSPAPNDSSAQGYNTSDFMTPDTTNNHASAELELDAFKLCRMKFDAEDKRDGKMVVDKVFDASNSRPRLIFSSKRLPHNRTEEEDEFCDYSCDSFHASRIVVGGGHNEVNKHTLYQSQFHSSQNSFYPSFDISVIPTQESSASFSMVPKSASCLPTRPTSNLADDNTRRKTLEPKYMSTPVADTIKHGASVVKKKSTLAKKVLLKQHKEKENQSPLCRPGSNRSRSSGSISSSEESSMSRDGNKMSRKEALSFATTPKSSIPPSQRHRILVSMNRLQSNHSYSCNDLTFDREVGMTTLFDRAEHQRTVGAGSQSLPLEDKEELERLIDQVRIGDSPSSDPPQCFGVGDSSILQAVLGVGDAMADFVQATADVQMRTRESTYL